MITDMTQGSPTPILFRFSLPLLLSMAFQQLYNIVDSIVAGQYIGEDALAAVGASYPITLIFMAVATGSNIGCSVVISQLFGGRLYAKMKTAVSTSILSVLGLSLLLTALGLLTCDRLMVLLNTPENIFSDSALYLRIYIAGLLFLFLYNICTGIFTALGDSRTPLYFLIASSLGNIVLDLIFVIVFQMGVSGVAWATFIAQGLSSLLALFALLRRLRWVETAEPYPLFSAVLLRDISLIAIPSILQQSFISVGNLLIQGLINSYGSAVVAGYSASCKINTFAVNSLTTLGSGVSSFTAQNIGAGQPERVTRGFRSGLLITLSVAVVFSLVFFCFPSWLVGLFMDSESIRAMEVGVRFLRIVSPFYCVIGTKLVADGILRGSGAMREFMVATFSDLILRVSLSFLLALAFGLGSTGIWISWPTGWSIGAILSMLFYFNGSWKRGKKVAV